MRSDARSRRQNWQKRLGNCRKCLIPKELCKTKSGLKMKKATKHSVAFSWLLFAGTYQQAGAPSWVTAAFGAFASGPVKIPQFCGVLVTAGLVIVAFQPAAST